MTDADTDPSIRLELGSILELLATLAQKQGDVTQAEQHLFEAVRINREMHERAPFNVMPLCNLLRVHLRLHAMRATDHGDLDRALRLAAELRRLEQRGARLPEECAGLFSQLPDPIDRAAPAPAASARESDAHFSASATTALPPQ
jgi:hypothetical protein